MAEAPELDTIANLPAQTVADRAEPVALRLALAQLNPTVGDIKGNAELIRAARGTAALQGADLLALPELVLTGYPPEDLVLRPSLLDAVEKALAALANETESGPAMLVTAPTRRDGLIYNAVHLLDRGAIQAVRLKHELPNYGVFDEKRVFSAGPLPEPISFRGLTLGVPICEDVWYPKVAAALAATGAELLIVPNGSPFELGKVAQRLELARERTAETGLAMVYLNQVGGQDELVFDGGSFVVDSTGAPVAALAGWEPVVTTVSFRRGPNGLEPVPTDEAPTAPLLDRVTHTAGGQPDDTEMADDAELAETYAAMMLGLRDYVGKNRFPGVVLGLSGGIDSAISAAVAVDALGPDKVHCVRLPSRFTSAASQDDAADCAERLGIELLTVPISDSVTALEATLEPLFGDRVRDTTEENLQARARGILLMALSNKFGWMVLTTGNKSEMSVGYATLYGDMCGGFSVLKDVYKTAVFALSHWRNRHLPAGALGPSGLVIPEAIIAKPPTAELRPNQTDQDSLPPYDVLDAILQGLIEREEPAAVIAARGYPLALVRRVQNMLYLAEYKRRQAPPGVKISRRNLSRDRRYPITNAFRDP
jgi:NAD+ synthase